MDPHKRFVVHISLMIFRDLKTGIPRLVPAAHALGSLGIIHLGSR